LLIVMIVCSIGLALRFTEAARLVLSYFAASLAVIGWGAYQRWEAWSSWGLAMLF
jgi:hypothetical protein